MTFVVAVVGARWDLGIEQEVLGPLGVEFRRAEGVDAEDILGAAAEADVVLAGGSPRFDVAVIERLRSGAGIVRYGVGTDTVDLVAAARRGIVVARVADYGTEAVAVHTVALALAATRRIVAADALLRDGGWGIGALRPLHAPSAQVAGVVGYGRIGRAVAGMLCAVGFEVLVHDPFQSVDQVGLDELLERSDLVTLHAPGAPDGSALLDAAALGRMRQGSALVNTARGTLVDLPALVDGLRRGAPAVAALDVFPVEPPDLAVLDEVRDRVIVTPHMAWYTEESERDLRRKASEEARRLLLGERPLEVVA